MSETKKETKEIVVVERVEKLTAAIYLVTGLLSEQEPMKKTLRESSLSLLSKTNLMAHDTVKDKLCLYEESLFFVAKIQSELSVARLSGVLSEMNSSLLLQGFTSLQAALVDGRRSLLISINEASSSSEFLLALEKAEIKNGAPEADSFETAKDLIVSPKETTSLRVVTEPKLSPARADSDDTKVLPVYRPEKSLPTGVFKARKVNRREQILSLFVKGNDISIKDISTKIKGCSEKTIQRELNSLVFDHIVERIGEKRWSRYVLR